MPLLAIALPAAGTYAFRLAGPVFQNRLRIPEPLDRLLSAAAAGDAHRVGGLPPDFGVGLHGTA